MSRTMSDPIAAPIDPVALDLPTTWLEAIGGGFPDESLGRRLQALARADSPLPAPQVVETAGGLVLSDTQLDVAVGFAEFLAGTAFTEPRRDDARAELCAGFLSDPVQLTIALNEIIGSFVQIPRTSPEHRATLRHRAHTVIALEHTTDRDNATVAAIEAANPVLHVDEGQGLVITADAVDAYWSLYDLVAVLAGQTPSTPVDRVAFSADLATLAPTWPVRVRAEIAFARSRWVAFRAVVRSMDDDQRQRLATALHDQIDDGAGVAAAVTGLGLAAGAAATARRFEAATATAGSTEPVG